MTPGMTEPNLDPPIHSSMKPGMESTVWASQKIISAVLWEMFGLSKIPAKQQNKVMVASPFWDFFTGFIDFTVVNDH